MIVNMAQSCICPVGSGATGGKEPGVWIIWAVEPLSTFRGHHYLAGVLRYLNLCYKSSHLFQLQPVLYRVHLMNV